MFLNLIKIKILSFQIRKFPRLCIHISRSRARSWPRRQKGSVEEGGGEGVDSVARILDVIAEAPLRLYTGK